MARPPQMIALPASPARPRRGRPSAVAALLAAALLVLAFGCAPKEEVDCQQSLADENYGRVIKSCEDPSARAMAYMGLAGFDFLDFVAADDPSDLVTLLGLTQSNISVKRELLNSAVREVGNPSSTQQAFMLLLSAFLAMSVTTTEYLDNGAGSGTALDNAYDDPEIEDATGLVVEDPAPLPAIDVSGADDDFFMAKNGNPYVVDCSADARPPICNGGIVVVYNDEDPLLGAGLDQTNVDGTPPALNTADVASQMAMLTDLDLAINTDPNKQDRLSSYLGQGTLDPDFPVENPELFPIGLLGYLGYIDLANLVLVAGAGGDIVEDEPAESTLNDAIDEARATLDNGATCFGDGSSVSRDAAALPLNLLYAMYAVAPGTDDDPAEGVSDYTGYNVVSEADVAASGATTLTGTDTEFGLDIGYKMLYPLTVGGVFNRINATPRIDETPQTFQDDFNLIPELAPNGAGLGDGRVRMIELLCISST